MDNRESKKARTGIIMLFDALPKLNAGQITGRIDRIEGLRQKSKLKIEVEEQGILRAFLEFDDHKLQLVGFSARVPDATLQHTIQVSNWQQQDKVPLQNHKAHIICFYEGANTDPTEQLIALYKTAFGFQQAGLLGFLDEDAWNCIPRRALEDFVKPDRLHSFRETVPLGSWTGFVKFFKSQRDVWFCTKAYHRFGLKDLAYLGDLNEANNAFTMFNNLFAYMRGGAKLNADETAQFSPSEFIRFRNVYEYHDFLDTPLETLVIEKISASGINKPAR